MFVAFFLPTLKRVLDTAHGDWWVAHRPSNSDPHLTTISIHIQGEIHWPHPCFLYIYIYIMCIYSYICIYTFIHVWICGGILRKYELLPPTLHIGNGFYVHVSLVRCTMSCLKDPDFRWSSTPRLEYQLQIDPYCGWKVSAIQGAGFHPT